MLVLGDRAHLLRGELAEPEAILERKHLDLLSDRAPLPKDDAAGARRVDLAQVVPATRAQALGWPSRKRRTRSSLGRAGIAPRSVVHDGGRQLFGRSEIRRGFRFGLLPHEIAALDAR
jgi:hypothetical protein